MSSLGQFLIAMMQWCMQPCKVAQGIPVLSLMSSQFPPASHLSVEWRATSMVMIADGFGRHLVGPIASASVWLQSVMKE